MNYNKLTIRKIVPKGKRIYWHKLKEGDTVDITIVDRLIKSEVSNHE